MAWLSRAQPRRLSTAAESILHEAALGHLSCGELEEDCDLALRAAVISHLDENHRALLIRLYRLAAENEAADRQFAAWTRTAMRELGTAPGAAVRRALRERPRSAALDATSIHALIAAGTAAVSAGAVTAAVSSFETVLRSPTWRGRAPARRDPAGAGRSPYPALHNPGCSPGLNRLATSSDLAM